MPASTFKIAHTLLALEADAVSGNSELFSWDGRPRGNAVWDRDTTLAEAIPSSTVWVFQEIANRLGHKREEDGVRRLQYGNQNVGGPADLLHFWLSGPLEISANEQVAFLAKLRAGLLDSHKRDQTRTVALLRLADCGQGCTVYGKTGAVLPIDDAGFLRTENKTLVPVGAEPTGWFVGWVDRSDSEGGPVVFAHNLNLSIPDAMNLRTAVAYKILMANDILTEAP